MRALLCLLLLTGCVSVVPAGEPATARGITFARVVEPGTYGAVEVPRRKQDTTHWVVDQWRIDASEFTGIATATDDFGGPAIQVALGPEAAMKMAEVSGGMIGETMALIVDGEVVLAAMVNSVLFGQMVIQGDYTWDEVADLIEGMGGPRR